MNPGDKMQKPSAVPTPDLFPSLSYPNQRAKLFVPPPGMLNYYFLECLNPYVRFNPRPFSLVPT